MNKELEALAEKAYELEMEQSLRPQDKAQVIAVCSRFLAAVQAQQEPWVDDREFYELMQAYRHSDLVDPHPSYTVETFEAVKNYIKSKVAFPPAIPKDMVLDKETYSLHIKEAWESGFRSGLKEARIEDSHMKDAAIDAAIAQEKTHVPELASKYDDTK